MYSSLFFSTPVFWAKADAKIRRFLILTNFFFADEWYVFDNTLSDSGLDAELFLILYWEWSVEGCCMVWKGGLFGGFVASFLTKDVDKYVKPCKSINYNKRNLL